MEDGENILDAIYEEDDDNLEDIEMVDVEEGELVDHHQNGVVAQNHNLIHETEGNNINNNNQKPKPLSRNRKRKANKRKKKGLGSDSIDINRFVIETCRRLKEKKSYMVYTAVGCLGVSALSDLVKEITKNCGQMQSRCDCRNLLNHNIVAAIAVVECDGNLEQLIQVDAIQSCGGQKTADGKRFRTGGGVLWSIIKVREPKAYKEIMTKAREFEKQFRQPSFKQPLMQQKENSSQGMPCTFSSGHVNVSDNTCVSQMQDQLKPSGSEEKRVPVHDRLRIPVSYDDDLLKTSIDNDATLP